jgi:hypothetical protein
VRRFNSDEVVSVSVAEVCGEARRTGQHRHPMASRKLAAAPRSTLLAFERFISSWPHPAQDQGLQCTGVINAKEIKCQVDSAWASPIQSASLEVTTVTVCIASLGYRRRHVEEGHGVSQFGTKPA